jgi:WD40 repeat protein
LQSLGLLASGAGDGKIIVLELFKAITPPVQDGQRNGDGAAEASAPSTAAEKRARDVPQVKAVPIAAVRDAHGVADVNCVSWLERDNGRGAGVLASCADDGSVRVWRVVADE